MLLSKVRSILVQYIAYTCNGNIESLLLSGIVVAYHYSIILVGLLQSVLFKNIVINTTCSSFRITISSSHEPHIQGCITSCRQVGSARIRFFFCGSKLPSFAYKCKEFVKMSIANLRPQVCYTYDVLIRHPVMIPFY